MRIAASVWARARGRVHISFCCECIVCRVLGPYEGLERPLISCEWLPSSSYDTSRRRLTGFPLSLAVCVTLSFSAQEEPWEIASD